MCPCGRGVLGILSCVGWQDMAKPKAKRADSKQPGWRARAKAYVKKYWKLAAALVVGSGAPLLAILVTAHLLASNGKWPVWTLPALAIWLAMVTAPAWAHWMVYFWKIEGGFKAFGLGAEARPSPKPTQLPPEALAKMTDEETELGGNREWDI